MSTSVANRFAFVLILSLLAGLLILLVTYNLLKLNGSQPHLAQVSELVGAPSIKDLPNRAFGKISANTDSAAPAPAEAQSATVASGRGGGGNPTSLNADDSKIAAEPGVSEPFAPYPVIQYEYAYAGDQFSLDDVSDAVYRRVDGFDIGNAGNGLKQLQLGPIDLSRFRNTDIQSFGLMQDDKNGYTIYVDPTYGNISISGNEGIWGYQNGDYRPLTNTDRPSNEDAIGLVDKFLSDYGINTSDFGEPIVDERDYYYALLQPEALRYVPESMNIVYPFMLDGQLTYNNDGSPQGLFVSLNLRTKKVASVNLNLASGYEKSSYTLVRDVNKILDIAKKGGLYNYYPVDYGQENVQVITIELGTPEVILANHYIYDGNNSQTLFVPSLSFPVIKNSDTYPVYQQSIVIPLVQDILDDQQSQPPVMYLDTKEEVAN